MKKISQGKYEIFTTKEDAIDKFMQLQCLYAEDIMGEKQTVFICSKKGKISITNPANSRLDDNSTNLYGQVVRQDGKTYVTYYTAFSKFTNVSNYIFIILNILSAILVIVLTVKYKFNIYKIMFLLLILVADFSLLIKNSKEKKNLPKVSEILIKELEKRVVAVNQWDK